MVGKPSEIPGLFFELNNGMEWYIDNKYSRWYFGILQNAQNRTLTGYTERHHKIPKSLGGTNSRDNLVDLTAREHFICHKILTKCTTGKSRCKMTFALWKFVIRNGESKFTSHDYAQAKKGFQAASSKLHKGKVVSEETRAKMRGPRHHVNQTGRANNNFQGLYVTPWGNFESSTIAAVNAPKKVTYETIVALCWKRNTEVFKRSKFMASKTRPCDNGFGFLPKEQTT